MGVAKLKEMCSVAMRFGGTLFPRRNNKEAIFKEIWRDNRNS